MRSSKMAIKYAPGKSTVSAQLKTATAILLGLITALISGRVLSWSMAPLLGWDVTAVVFTAWTWATVWRMDGATTASHASREDPSRVTADVVIVGAAIASLFGVAVMLLGASNATGAAKYLLATLGVASVVSSWTVVHTIFTLRYAELYYRGSAGGVDFLGTTKPDYKDFAYLAFTLGMTFQVSDTQLETSAFRRLALRHALTSYLFGTVIVATTINLVAGLSK